MLKCNVCGREESAPFAEGDACHDGCGVFAELPVDSDESVEVFMVVCEAMRRLTSEQQSRVIKAVAVLMDLKLQ